MKKIDLTGQRFGRLVVLGEEPRTTKEIKWRCLCDCGNETVVYGSNLRRGHTKSCGCLEKGHTADDITGLSFGRLTVIERAGLIYGSQAQWKCRCECGNVCYVSGDVLKSGRQVSCGCYRIEHSTIHGKYKTKLYRVYISMKSRCRNPNDASYHRYGGRGISVCEEWKNDFMNFYNWAIQSGYREGLTIDRIDNDGNYEPSNCQWLTRGENTRKAHYDNK